MVLYNLLSKVEFLLFDLHGVVIASEGQTISRKELKDLSEDLKRAEKAGIKCGIISATEDTELLGIIKDLPIAEIFSHSLDKVSQAEKLLNKYNLKYENIGYIGDDILDIPLLMKAGFSAAPRSARREVKRIVNYVTRNSEGKTVLSDILDLITKAREVNESGSH